MNTNVSEIARRLNISKATVSLALNNRPGVSEKTREAVLRCREELERQPSLVNGQRIIKILTFNRYSGNTQNLPAERWTEPLAIYDKEARRMGYLINVSVINPVADEIQQAVEDAGSEQVGGIILYATAITQAEFEPFARIKKPMVVYDNAFTEQRCCVCADNQGAAALAVDVLAKAGYRHICYMGSSTDMFNFNQRKKGFRSRILEHGLSPEENPICELGRPGECRSRAMEYLQSHPLPDAIITENCYISMEVLRVLSDLKISIPGDIAFIGIDRLPEYFSMDDIKPVTVEVDHTERARAAIGLLEKEMRQPMPVKFKVYSSCRLTAGNTVGQR